jgi:hypothetical protein
MKRLTFFYTTLLVLWALLPVALVPSAAQQNQGWPTLQAQLARAGVAQGSALEQLIRANQDFALLRLAEANDKLPYPPWLRVLWRKAHPGGRYTASDPTGGYPHVLREIYEWLITHQDLRRGQPEPHITPNRVLRSAVIGPNTRISGAQSTPRSESDIRVNFLDPNKIISAANNISASGLQAQFYSTDGGATWGQTTLGSLFAGDMFHSDPSVDWTSDGRAWSLTLGINNPHDFNFILKGRSYVSVDNGATWSQDGTFSANQAAVDKPLMWVDHSATSPFKDNIYAIWHNDEPAFMNRRIATGWQTPILVSGAESVGTAIGADVKTNSLGEVFGFWPTTGNSKIFVVKSVTGGATYNAPVQLARTFGAYDIGVPAFSFRRALIYVSGGAYRTATKNLVYAAWTDLSGETNCTTPADEPANTVTITCKTRIWFSRSTDGGATWSPKVMINNQTSLNDQFNQWLAVDETNGGLGIMYYDTVADAGRKKADVWYQRSSNDGVSWDAPVKVTTAQTDETVSGTDYGNQFGDYNGLSGYAGMFFPSWTDRRSGGKEEIWTAKLTQVQCTGLYVDAAYVGVELGTQLQPYRTVTAALNAAADCTSANIYIRANAYNEQFTVSKNVKLLNWGNTGVVKIGSP